MSFEQQTFLGSTITQFNCSIGWQDTPTVLRTTLVTDPTNGDSFVDPVVGTIGSFNFNGWAFDGVIKSWKKRNDETANPTYDVILEDPREVLEGVQLILDGYTGGTAGLPNLMNIYGYWENVSGFGESDRNNAGIPWRKITEALEVLTRNEQAVLIESTSVSSSNPSIPSVGDSPQSEDYGGPIRLGSVEFTIDLSGLPVLPDSYRIGAKEISLLGFIKEICDAANHDFFFTLSILNEVNARAESINAIVLNTIDRNVAPINGQINQFITSLDEVHGKSVGFEFRNEVTSKFLAGGNVSRIYLQSKEGGDDEDLETDPEQNSIWYYWGKDSSGDVIIGECLNDEHNFVLDARWVFAEGLGDTYHTNIAEMRAAVDSQTSWEAYLSLNNWNEYLFDPDGESFSWLLDVTDPSEDPISDILQGPPIDHGDLAHVWVTNDRYYPLTSFDDRGVETEVIYAHDNKKNPHFGKFTDLNLSGYLSADDLATLMQNEDLTQINRFAIASMIAMNTRSVAAQAAEEEEEYENGALLYPYVKEFADEYYGKKFMVRIPFVSVAEESETGVLLQSQTPEDSGFLDESEWADAVADNLLPFDINKFSEENGRIFCYMRFDHADYLDFSDIPEEDIAFNYTSKEDEKLVTASDPDEISGRSAFVRCTVEPRIVFEDRDTQYSPRVVVTMPGIVTRKTGLDSRQYYGVLASMAYNMALAGGPDVDSDQIIKDTMSAVGSDLVRLGREGQARIPDIVGVPLKSNTQTYGPWTAGGAGGKVDFEQDDSLVPWNYGGFEVMNLAGDAKVSSALSNYQSSEGGYVSFPGIPVLNIGAQLIGGGPYISNVNVEVSDKGVISTYRMETWQPHPYKLRKHQAETATRLAQIGQRERRNARERELSQIRAGAIRRRKNLKNLPQNEIGSSHAFMVGQVFSSTSGENPQYSSEVYFQAPYNSTGQLNKDYDKKALMSLDAMFRPFTTDVDASGYAHFERPSLSGTEITVESLNPFVRHLDINTATFGSGDATMPQSLDLSRHSKDIHFYGSYDRGGITTEPYKDMRGMALRTPVIFTGWGYDKNGLPVPNSGISDTGSGEAGNFFHQDYLTRSDLWKTGPLDTRWDDQRKVWIATGGEQKLVQILDAVPADVDVSGLTKGSGVLFFSADNVYPIGIPEDGTYLRDADQQIKGGFVYYVQEYTLGFDNGVGNRVTLTASDNYHYVGNFRPNVVEPSGFWIAANVGGKLYLDSQFNFWDYNTTSLGSAV